MRLPWLIGGHLALLLGVIGIFLPLLPTTPFLILASFCYSKGSPRFEAWLLAHPRLGPIVRDWRESRVIRPRAKAFALITLALSVAYVLSRSGIPMVGKIAMLVIVIPVAVFIATRPGRSVHDPTPTRPALPPS